MSAFSISEEGRLKGGKGGDATEPGSGRRGVFPVSAALLLTGGGFPRRVPIFRTITLTPTTTDDVGDERCHLGWRTFQRDADETVVFGL